MNDEQGHTSKSSLRCSIRSVLDSMPPEERREKSSRIFQKVIETESYRRSKEINALMIYLHFGSEVQTVPQFCAAPDYGMPVIVPFCEDNEIVPFKIFSFDELEVGTFGILEPKLSVRLMPERLVMPEEIRCILVPGLAFDRQCRRLGRGKGYYDRFLKQLPPDGISIGLAFERQIVENLPIDDWDKPLSMLITEERSINSGS